MIATNVNLTEEQQLALNNLYAAVGDLTGTTPTNVHEYLTIIDELMKNMKDNLDANVYNLLKFPVTEPVFEINPDTRDIIVPKAFKENGLTIQGDKLAEIVWFKIPRFFDLTDFYNFNNNGTKQNSDFEGYHTYIEWYNPSGKDEHQKGVDLAYAMTCDADYVYFGWPLADKVSGDAGTIQFTVRFLGVKEGAILYNFSTKIQSCIIKSTLNFDLLGDNYTADSWEDLIYSRPVYSGVVNSIESYSPIILQGLVDGKQDLVKSVVHHEAVAEQGTPGEDGYVAGKDAYDEEVYGLDLVVKAAAANRDGITQELQFEWQQQIENMSGFGEVARPTNRIVDAALTGDDARGYNVAGSSTFTVSKVGRYTVYIGNKINDSNKIRYVYTGIVEVPRPTKAQLDESGMAEKGYTDIVWTNQYTNEPTRQATTLQVVVTNPVEGDEIVYQWKRDVPTSKDALGNVIYTPEEVPADEDGDKAIISPKKEGKYYVTVITKRNGESVEKTSDKKCDLRELPQHLGGPGITPGTHVHLDYDENAKTFTASLVNQKNIGHKVQYTWYFEPTVGRTQTDDAPTTLQVVQVGGEDGVALNNAVFAARWEAGTYHVEAKEIVFDTEEDNTNSSWTTHTPQGERGVSNYIQLVDNFKVYTPVEPTNP